MKRTTISFASNRRPTTDQCETGCKICRRSILTGQSRVWLAGPVTGLVHVACQDQPNVDGGEAA